MLAARFTGLTIAIALMSSAAFAQVSGDPSPWLDRAQDERLQPSLIVNDRDAMGLPGLRPRLRMSVPLGFDNQAQAAEPSERSTFSWSLEAWQLNTASLAHIQCRHHTLTLDSFLAEDCRFVDQPVPENSVNLVQVRGEWMAAPGLRFGLGAFRNQHSTSSLAHESGVLTMTGPRHISALSGSDRFTASPVDGVDLNVSFGLSTDRIGDFLVGLQVARYRQRMSLVDLGLMADDGAFLSDPDLHYANSAQISLGWRRGSLGGDILGHHRDAPYWLAGSQGSAPFSSFDLEFSWRPKNASLSIGISNVLDSAPRLEDGDAAGMDDPLEHVFGRIPYVRYKHDL